MLQFVVKRILKCAVTVAAAAVLVFTILYFAEDDPASCLLAKSMRWTWSCSL